MTYVRDTQVESAFQAISVGTEKCWIINVLSRRFSL